MDEKEGEKEVKKKAKWQVTVGSRPDEGHGRPDEVKTKLHMKF